MAATLESRAQTALSALVIRNVTDVEGNPELVLIAGLGYTDEQVDALVKEWMLLTEGHERIEVVSHAADAHADGFTSVIVDRDG